MNARLLILSNVFTGWSIFGLRPLIDLWIGYGKWWALLVYIVVHLGLAGMILRTTGLRLWPIVFCLLGLAVGERDVIPTFYAFTAWTFVGFV
jgi:hypothetical protein